MRILGIDPGSIATGYGIVDLEASRVSHVRSGVLRPPAGELATRLAWIQERLTRIVGDLRPQALDDRGGVHHPPQKRLDRLAADARHDARPRRSRVVHQQAVLGVDLPEAFGAGEREIAEALLAGTQGPSTFLHAGFERVPLAPQGLFRCLAGRDLVFERGEPGAVVFG